MSHAAGRGLKRGTQAVEGRWEGRVEIPGSELAVVVDIAPGPTGGWAGSIVIPGLGVKGAALTHVVVTDTSVSFELGNVLDSPGNGAAAFRGRVTASDRITGEMRQAGNVAPLALQKIGPAQVELSPRSTPVARDLEAQWSGEFELSGYARHVTITLENRAEGGASARLVIVGKRTNDLPVDLVVQQGQSLRIESQTSQVTFEGRIFAETGEIRGTLALGSIELPLTLRRSARSTS